MDVDDAITQVSKDISVVLKDIQHEAIKSFCSGRDVLIARLPDELSIISVSLKLSNIILTSSSPINDPLLLINNQSTRSPKSGDS